MPTVQKVMLKSISDTCLCFVVQVVALVGPSGGGKSSIVKLVERFYLPSAGAVRMDGRDVGIYDEKWLHRKVAIVSQEPVLYGRRYLLFTSTLYVFCCRGATLCAVACRKLCTCNSCSDVCIIRSCIHVRMVLRHH